MRPLDSSARGRRALQLLRNQGAQELARRGIRYAHQRLGVAELDFPLLPRDIADSVATDRRGTTTLPPVEGRAKVGWITTPPGLGSGGHTTMFRMIKALEDAGHECVIFLYDRYAGQIEQQAATIRRGWPDIKAEISDCSTAFGGVDAVVATSWQTAHVLRTRLSRPLRSFYFVQDFEPFFTGHGSEYIFAEDSYRLGHHCIALGEMVAGHLRSIGVSSDRVDFGCDTGTYFLIDPPADRNGVVFYTRPNAPRRGYLLGVLALESFHRRHPDQTIHLYGDSPRDLPFPARRHGSLRPSALNQLYNTVIAGLAMSFTNISLVAAEMISSGVIPVVNDSADSRADLCNEHVRWARPTPAGIADCLSDLVVADDAAARAKAAAASTSAMDWEATSREVVRVLDEACRTPRRVVRTV